jgi:hypothetical protein
MTPQSGKVPPQGMTPPKPEMPVPTAHPLEPPRARMPASQPARPPVRAQEPSSVQAAPSRTSRPLIQATATPKPPTSRPRTPSAGPSRGR